jgi:hypothetical protein
LNTAKIWSWVPDGLNAKTDRQLQSNSASDWGAPSSRTFCSARQDYTPPSRPLPVLYLCPFPSSVHFTLKMEAVRSTETLLYYHITTRRQNSRHVTWIFIAVKTSSLAFIIFVKKCSSYSTLWAK